MAGVVLDRVQHHVIALLVGAVGGGLAGTQLLEQHLLIRSMLVLVTRLDRAAADAGE